ncbi:hypothetical protein GH733_017960, partial [Mirounga leonina]
MDVYALNGIPLPSSTVPAFSDKDSLGDEMLAAALLKAKSQTRTEHDQEISEDTGSHGVLLGRFQKDISQGLKFEEAYEQEVSLKRQLGNSSGERLNRKIQDFGQVTDEEKLTPVGER